MTRGGHIFPRTLARTLHGHLVTLIWLLVGISGIAMLLAVRVL